MSIDHASALEVVASGSGQSVPETWGGDVRGSEFLTSTHRTARCREMADDGYLVARVVPNYGAENEPTVKRAELRNALEGAVEISLALRGALPPSVEIGAPVGQSVQDQIYRLRKLGAPGLCIVLPELSAIAEGGQLGPEDSAALQAWREMSEQHPVVLLFDEADQEISMLTPRRLDEVFPMPQSTPTSWPDDARSLLDQTPTDHVAVATEVEDGWEDASPAPPEVEAKTAVETTEPEANTDDEMHAAPEMEEDVHETEEGIELADEREDPPLSASVYEAPTRPGKRIERVIASDPLAGLDLDDTSDSDVGEPIQRSLFAAAAASSHAPRGASYGRAPRRPRMAPAEVARLCAKLDEAEGPKPVSTIQDLFQTCYTPLLEALSSGLDDPDAERVVDNWRQSFEKSYGEGFNTMRVTGRRPPMVLDAPDVATKIAKLNGARAAQLLLVDGMRFDLGLRVHRELSHLLDGTAVCVDRPILWSALPSITPVQMHLLARGPRALKEELHSEREPQIHRDGSLTTLRRVRIGQRDLIKLDLVEARLREAGPGFETRMSSLAEEVADVIAGYAEELPPRTLLFIFGDHGFYMPTGGPDATGPADQGNATPEEVLIGAQAWLVGAVN